LVFDGQPLARFQHLPKRRFIGQAVIVADPTFAMRGAAKPSVLPLSFFQQAEFT